MHHLLELELARVAKGCEVRFDETSGEFYSTDGDGNRTRYTIDARTVRRWRNNQMAMLEANGGKPITLGKRKALSAKRGIATQGIFKC